ncbi:MAG: hypothetical protein Ct9H300mP16_14930 [Pseudomonadota bacterium]|nr:MAG: hypothetical protein Ct9H300mP16_14930 [Pseudomonadota bacterium]
MAGICSPLFEAASLPYPEKPGPKHLPDRLQIQKIATDLDVLRQQHRDLLTVGFNQSGRESTSLSSISKVCSACNSRS